VASTALDFAGKIIFRLRSIAPVAVILVVVPMTWRSHVNPLPGDELLNWVGLALALFGQVIRLFTIASVPKNTSLQSRTMQAASLNTTGPYAVVRHPLYLGNYFITIGMLCIAHELWAWALGIAYLVGSQWLIARTEDALLREKFGAQFDTWSKEVHSIWPRLSHLKDVTGPFEWKRTIQREINVIGAWGSGAVLLLLWETFVRGGLTRQIWWTFVAIQAALLVMLIVNKLIKKLKPA